MDAKFWDCGMNLFLGDHGVGGDLRVDRRDAKFCVSTSHAPSRAVPRRPTHRPTHIHIGIGCFFNHFHFKICPFAQFNGLFAMYSDIWWYDFSSRIIRS